jgi:hypothetical protein
MPASGIEQNARLGAKGDHAARLVVGGSPPILCDISLWEVATLVERRRPALDVAVDEWLADTAHRRSVRLTGLGSRRRQNCAAAGLVSP